MFEGLATIMAMSGAFFIFSLIGGKKKAKARPAKKKAAKKRK